VNSVPAALPFPHSRTWRSCSTHSAGQGFHQYDHQLARSDHLGHVHRRRRKAGCARRPTSRHHSERHPEGIHRTEGIHLPPAPSMRLVVDTMEFGAQSVPQWNTISISGYHIREAGIHSRAGTGLHPGRWHGVRPLGHPAPAWMWTTSPRACRSSSTRTTISSRRSPSTAPPGASGRARCADLQGPGFPIMAASLPYPDGRVFAHRAAAREQCGPRCHPGPRRRSRRDPEPSPTHSTRHWHCLRARRNHRAKDPADHCRGVRRRQHHRPPRRKATLLRRARITWSGPPTSTSSASMSSAA